MAALPIRLVRRDNKVIELDCTNYAMTVKRRVTPMSVPLSGERLGYDLNQVESAIRLECILTDDDCGDTDFTVGQASGYIDFSGQLNISNGSGEVINYMQGDEGTVTRSDLDGTVITINAVPASGTVADIINITLSSSASSHTITSSGSEPATHDLTVGLNQSTDTGVASADTGAFIAESIFDAMEDFAALRALLELDTTTLAAGELPSTGNSRLNIKMKHAGSVNSFDDMVIAPAGDTPVPLAQTMLDDEASSCFSAGDKAQNLIGVAINNGVLGVVGSIHGFEGLFAGDGVTDLVESIGQGVHSQQDYIVGLQIPYNSFNGLTDVYGTTNETVPQGYTARNFYYGTGFGNTAKGANDNALEASTTFDVTDKYTGIRGTVLAVDVDYQAGETVYTATITFQPLDAWGSA